MCFSNARVNLAGTDSNHISPPQNTIEENVIPFRQNQSKEARISGATMKSHLIHKAAEVIPDPQVLINVVSQRVRQLNEGRSPLIKALPSMGIADIALQEIVEGKITWGRSEAQANQQ